MIKVKLQPDKGRNPDEICRVIERNKGSERGTGRAASTFYINDVKASQKDVVKLVHETYNISVENLCTFLPQDKVGNFSGFTPQNLLIETEKSMSGSQHLYKCHQELIELELEFQKGDTDVSQRREVLQKLETDHARLSREVERNQEREKALLQIELLQKKKLWLVHDQLHERALALKEEKAKAKQAVQLAQAERVTPLETDWREASRQYDRLSNQYRTADKETQDHVNEAKKQDRKCELHCEKTDVALSEVQSCDSDKRSAQRAVEAQRQKLEEQQALAADQPSMEDADATLKDSLMAYKEAKPAFDEATHRCRSLAADISAAQQEVERHHDKLKGFQDHKKQKRLRIFREHKNLEKICGWVDQNRRQFRYPVFGPVCAEVFTMNKNSAAFLEQHVPNSVLKSFVVQSREDYNLLYREVREKLGIPINIVVVDKEKKAVRRIYSEIFMKELKQKNGVLGYLDEAVDGPEEVLTALRESASIHSVLVGSETTQHSLDQEGLKDKLSRPVENGGRLRGFAIFASRGTKSFKYQGNVSRHNGQIFLSQDEITPARLLAPGINQDLLQKTQDDLETARRHVDDLNGRLQEAEEKSAHVTAAAREAKSQLDDAKKTKITVKRTADRVQSATDKLKRLEEALVAASQQGNKRKCLTQLQNHIKASITALEKHAGSNEAMMKSTMSSAGKLLSMDMKELVVRQLKTQLDDAKAELRHLTEKYQTATDSFKTAKAELKVAHADAIEQAPISGTDSDGNSVELPLKATLEALEANSLEEVDVALEESNATAEGIEHNPHVVRQYEKIEKDISQLRKELDGFEDEKEARVTQLDHKASQWKSALKNAAEKVNRLFAQYMGEIGCAGEVGLKEGGYTPASEKAPKYGNFKSWGIQIQVRFREKASMSVLSAQVHSGGERSVSTIMFLMALQELMVAPFRCVDEINQGLDERNERLVFKRIVQNSTRPPIGRDLSDHSGQYFLITPKLLPNLYDMEEEGVTVHVINNGPLNLMKQLEFSPTRIVPILKSKKGHSRVFSEHDSNSAEEHGVLGKRRKKRKVTP
uniref:Structural maintenance of chromosomes protein 5 n=1 Tax=Grammatophora oceanica TaxID=210454 RepID=A0A7S1Y5K8_9STRA